MEHGWGCALPAQGFSLRLVEKQRAPRTEGQVVIIDCKYTRKKGLIEVITSCIFFSSNSRTHWNTKSTKQHFRPESLSLQVHQAFRVRLVLLVLALKERREAKDQRVSRDHLVAPVTLAHKAHRSVHPIM